MPADAQLAATAAARSAVPLARLDTTTTRCAAVLGHPIGHSLSPALHTAAYEFLGLPWQYDAVDVTEDALADYLAGRGPEWIGLSLTMPLKKRVLELVDTLDEVARRTGSANTLVLSGEPGRRSLQGVNTDVEGIVVALRESGRELDVTAPLILGAGATAASTLAALAQLGAQRVSVLVRSVSRTAELWAVADALEIALDVAPLGDWDARAPRASIVVSTLPHGAADVLAGSGMIARGVEGVLLDVAYGAGPTVLGAAWRAAGGAYISGERMLLHQAVAQVMLFTGLAHRPNGLVEAMDAALHSRS